MALGFILGRTGWITVSEARVINRFTLSVFLPIFLFGVSSQVDIARFTLLPIGTYLAVEFIVFMIGFTLAFHVLHRDASESLLLGMSGVVANNAFYVLPIALALYGPQGAQPFVAITTVDGLIGFSAVILALEFVRHGRISWRVLGLAIIRSPIILALMAGIAFAASGLVLPQPVTTFVDFNGAAAAPVALFALGVVLSETTFRRDVVVALFVGVKLILFPACVWAAINLVSYRESDAPIYVLSAAGPSVAMSLSLAILYNVRTETIAQVMVWTGLFSLVSLMLLA